MPKSEPVVRVVIPTFRRPHLLGRAIESVQHQTYKDWELVVVDDNPEGGIGRGETEATLYPYLRSDSRIRAIQGSGGVGGSAARNSGAKGFTGPFLAFLDDDDEWLPWKLNDQVLAMESADSTVAVAYSGHRIIKPGEPDREFRLRSLQGTGLPRLLFRNQIGPTSSILIRTEAFNGVNGFDPNFVARQEYDLFITLVTQGWGFRHVPGIAFLFHNHENGRVSDDVLRRLRGLKMLMVKHCAVFSHWPTAAKVHLVRVVKSLIYHGYGEEARRLLIDGWGPTVRMPRGWSFSGEDFKELWDSTYFRSRSLDFKILEDALNDGDS